MVELMCFSGAENQIKILPITRMGLSVSVRGNIVGGAWIEHDDATGRIRFELPDGWSFRMSSDDDLLTYAGPLTLDILPPQS